MGLADLLCFDAPLPGMLAQLQADTVLQLVQLVLPLVEVGPGEQRVTVLRVDVPKHGTAEL